MQGITHMCGIVGAVANRDITKILLDGLQRLEYRGYDSAGLAVLNKQDQLQCLRRVGKVKSLIEAVAKTPPKGSTGIAHTRWATHGEPNELNTHPHISGYIVVVHNGIIENQELLRHFLGKRGYTFISDTDTEVLAHLLHWEQNKNRGTLAETMIRIIPKIRGTYSAVIMDSRDHRSLVAVRYGSPLIIGLGFEENFIASDQLALLPVTKRFIFLEDGEVACVTSCNVHIWNSFGKIIERKEIKSQVKYNDSDKGSYCHYMQKEIFEQPKAIKNTIKDCLHQSIIDLSSLSIGSVDKILSDVQHLQITACGTSYHSAMVSRYWFEELARIPCDVEIASEFRYQKFVVRSSSLLILLSQSGETADTLAALRLSKNIGYIGSLAICNVSTSSLVRESDVSIITKAGTEVGVASTKSFTTQLTVLLMLVARISQLKSMDKKIETDIIHALELLPYRIKQVLSLEKMIKITAESFKDKNHVIFLGRGNLYPIAMEAALKLKEIAYVHAEAYAAGEMKHGPMALIDADIPVIVIADNNDLLEKLKSNIEEVRARCGRLYIFTAYNVKFSKDKNMNIIHLPYVEQIVAPIFYSVPMQLLAYHVALIKNTNIDQPRNLAKSVTVE